MFAQGAGWGQLELPESHLTTSWVCEGRSKLAHPRGLHPQGGCYSALENATSMARAAAHKRSPPSSLVKDTPPSHQDSALSTVKIEIKKNSPITRIHPNGQPSTNQDAPQIHTHVKPFLRVYGTHPLGSEIASMF